MRPCLTLMFSVLLLPTVVPSLVAAPSADFQPDPRSVQRQGAGYRYPQAGWIVLHIEGEPYERGYQHGHLLAPEIASYVRCFAGIQNSKATAEGWKTTRTLVNALFVRRFDREYLEEMKGIADGAAAAGAKFEGRTLDLVDIVAINCWAELETLDAALEATPNGLEGIRFPKQQPKEMPPAKPMHCSAFAAVGPATKDGKIVFGHVTMFDLAPSLHFNIWLDIKPSKGQRVVMQSFAGGIQSGMDYYINSAGLLILETTIAQTRFDPRGLSLASRIRKAVQYARTIDEAVEILKKDSNGLYSNEWMLADINKNEIAIFELGTEKSKLYRSGDKDWYGGTEGFYWGCNNAKDLQVRLETIASTNGKPANLVWKPADRDRKWLELYAKHKGKIDADFGKLAFTTAPLCSAITIDAKVTTTDLAKELKSWALFGPPLGKRWQPTDDDKQKFSWIRPLVSNPWTLLQPSAPAKSKIEGPAVVDLPDKIGSSESGKTEDQKQSILRTEDRSTATTPAWHGTILPKTDADIWLATAFADYEKIVALENSLTDQATDHKLGASDLEQLAVEHFTHRFHYLAAARVRGESALARTRSEVGHDEWYRMASGRGVLVLHELRKVVGDKSFAELMESFGKEHAGKEVTIAQFQAHVEKASGKKVDDLLDYWTGQTGLPILRLGEVQVTSMKQEGETRYKVKGEIGRNGGNGKSFPPTLVVEVTVETEKGEETQKVVLDAPAVSFQIETTEKPKRVIVDKYCRAARGNGGVFSVLAFNAELDQTLIVYGTADETEGNREAAEALQEAIRARWANITVPIKTDKQVKEEDLKTHHLLLIGRPDCNSVVERFRAALPVTFGSRSFVVRQDAYAHAGSSVIAAGANPLNPRYAITVLAGLGAEATTQLPAVLLKKDQANAEVFVVPNGGQPKALVIPAKELVRETDSGSSR